MLTVLEKWLTTGTILILATGIIAGETASIAIYPDNITGIVNPLVFGHNIVAANWESEGDPRVYGQTGNGLWNPKLQAPVREVVAISRQMGISILRYPGGCMTHNFKWKGAVGPVAQRPDYTFGLMEFLSFCQTIGAEPQMCVSEYTGGPQDAADLVEFLNAQATSEHPWAMKRAAWGHPEPYKVRFFEMGNESYHGNHGDYIGMPIKVLSPEEYSEWFNAATTLMKQCDSSIKTGAVLNSADSSWNATVISRVKNNADFMIDHFYACGFSDNKDEGIMVRQSDYLMRSCMASAVKLQVWIDELKKEIRKHAGKDIPLVISEYNASILNEKVPVPYRYSLGAALFSVDSIRIFLQPENNVLLANYWCYFNGFWGTVHGPADPNKSMAEAEWEKNPAFHLFQLWRNHFGTDLIAVSVISPEKDFEGGYGIPPCHPVSQSKHDNEPMAVPFVLANQQGKGTGMGKGFEWFPENGGIVLELKEFTGSAYPEIGRFYAKPGCVYRISYEGKMVDGTKEISAILGMGLVDSRGWVKTGSAVSAEGMNKAVDWKHFSGKMITVPGCNKVQILFRLRGGKQPVTATAMIRDIKIEELPESLPPYPVITAVSSVSADRKIIYLVVFNKDLENPIKTNIEVKDKSVSKARIWTVTGPATGTNTEGKQEVGLKVDGGTIPEVTQSGFSCELPPCSMSVVEIYRK